jgi:hypothetical protein
MPVDEIYRRQATLLVRAIPLVAAETCFALKGGTAINLFVRNMPRLSVDIDLTYLPIADRAASLKEIDVAMRRIADAISRGIPGACVGPSKPKGENCLLNIWEAWRRIEVRQLFRLSLEALLYWTIATLEEKPKGRTEVDPWAEATG